MSLGLGMGMGFGADDGAVAAAAAAAYTIVGSDDPTGDTGNLATKTLDNALGGSGDYTWSLAFGSAGNITYSSDKINFPPVNFDSVVVSGWNPTAAKVGMEYVGGSMTAGGQARLCMRAANTGTHSVWLLVADDAKPTIEAFNGSTFDVQQSLTSLDTHATGEVRKYQVLLHDSGTSVFIRVNQYADGDATTLAATQTYELADADYQGDADGDFETALQTVSGSGAFTLTGFTFGTHTFDLTA